MNTHDIDIDLPEHDCIYETTNESGFIDVEPAYRKSTVLRLIEADRKLHDRMLAHEWIRPSLGLDEDAPYRFDFYAQEIEKLKAELKEFGRNENDQRNDNDNRKRRFATGEALRRYLDCGGDEEPDPIERLRFYCSLAMSGQDWLDVEPFFDDLIADRKRMVFAGYQYQGRDGAWNNFMDLRHYENTVEDGTWPIRAIYTTTGQDKAVEHSRGEPSSLAEVWRINADEAEAYGQSDRADTLRECAAEVERLAAPQPADPDAATIADYEAVLADHRRLVRELDVLLNGEEGAAEQASLCDIVAQVRREGIKTTESVKEIELRAEDLHVSTYSPTSSPQWAAHNDRGVRIVHLPTGTVAESHEELSPHRNREIALDRLRQAIAAAPVNQHSDDTAVDAFAAAMKAKLAKKRAEGRGGWQTCSAEYLSRLLREHVEKGDPVDVANLAMMLHQNEQRIKAAEPVKVPSDDALVDALINLEYDNYEQSFSGYKNRQADIALIRAALARYRNTQQENHS